MSIEIMPPDTNASKRYFSVHDGKTRNGLMSIKNMRSTVIDEILAQRASAGPVRSFAEFPDRVDRAVVVRSVVETLIAGVCLRFLRHTEI